MDQKVDMNKKVVEAFERCPEILRIVIDVSEKTLLLARKKEKNMMLIFCISMLERIHAASEGIAVLLKEYSHNHRKFDFSIGIITRSVLLDYLIMLNVIEILHRKNHDPVARQEELETFCLTMLSDSAIHTLKYFKSNLDSIPKERLKGMYSMQVRLHEYCFEPYAHDGSEPILKIKKQFSQQELVKRLKKSKELSHLSRKEDWYMYYSKYDHFGQMYHGISKQSIADEFLNMDLALREFPFSLTLMLMLLQILYKEDESIGKQLSIISHLAQKISEIDDIEK